MQSRSMDRTKMNDERINERKGAGVEAATSKGGDGTSANVLDQDSV